MNIVEKVGQQVEKNIAAAPEVSRKWLNAAYSVVHSRAYLDKRHAYDPSFKRYNGVVAGDIVQSTSHPEDAALVNIFMPTEILQAMGLSLMYPEGISVYVANTCCAGPFATAAEENNVPESFCSYHKVMIGMAETDVLPKPRVIVNTTLACDANQLSFRRLAERWGVPHIVIDIPWRSDEDAVDYVEQQLIDMTAQLEMITGKRLDLDRLRKATSRSARTLQTLNEYYDLRGDVTIPTTMTGELLVMMATHFGLGSKEAERYAKDLLRIARKAPAASTSNKPRIFWMHTQPNWQMSMRDIFDNAAAAEIVANDMALDYLGEVDPSDPFRFMAQRIVDSSFNGPGSRRVQSALKMAQKTKAQGAIVFCHWGCKQTLGISQLAKRAFEEAGIPTLVLDGDGCDPRNVSDGQMITRVNAFIEQLGGYR